MNFNSVITTNDGASKARAVKADLNNNVSHTADGK